MLFQKANLSRDKDAKPTGLRIKIEAAGLLNIYSSNLAAFVIYPENYIHT